MPEDDQENVTLDNSKLYPIYSEFIFKLLELTAAEQAFCVASVISVMSAGDRCDFIDLVQEILPQIEGAL